MQSLKDTGGDAFVGGVMTTKQIAEKLLELRGKATNSPCCYHYDNNVEQEKCDTEFIQFAANNIEQLARDYLELSELREFEFNDYRNKTTGGF